ncbi:hypothetical protein [Bifidobacterium tibiigranuli]|jgi:hypothetical protein|uniref:hypothetical protein n=1 Tax=Bifidobacterium tibiigranuli TaxID=2172043 RepID=UPI0026F35025|nr:hypothetical protein [Bifidobacterium tibiigranuli]MCI1713102.1 hypothetical protein [Bifidobacterium tibiigranuli]
MSDDFAGDSRPGSAAPSATVMMVVQLAAYAIFALACAAGWLWGISEDVVTVLALAALLTFVVAWPLRSDTVARVVAAIVGVASIAAAALPADILGSSGECIIIPETSLQASSTGTCAADGALALLGTAISHWASTALVLLALLIIGGFLRQMLREQRTELVRSLSSFVLGGVTAVAAGAWVVTARVMRALHDADALNVSAPLFASSSSTWYALGGLLIVVAVMVALAIVSCRWWRELLLGSNSSVRAAWLGFVLMPVLIFGLAAFAYAFALVAMV